MGQQISPFIEVKYGWNVGESGWNSGMDENLLKMSFLLDGNVKAIVGSLPEALSGDSYFLSTDNRFYFAVGSTFYSTPCPKNFIFKVSSTEEFYLFDGSSAVKIDNPAQIAGKLSIIDELGSAAFQNIEEFATQGDLDVISAQSSEYTDELRDTLAGENGSANIGFSYPSEVSVRRTVLDKLEDVVTAEDFGAVGDGSQDDTDSVELASVHAAKTYHTSLTSFVSPARRTDLILQTPPRRVSSALIEERELTAPGNLGFTPTIKPIRKNGKWQGHIPALSLFPAVTGATYYVDPILGTPGAAGTEVAPLKSITEALEKPDVGQILVAPAPNVSLDDGAWANPTITTSSPQIILRPWAIRPGRPTVSTSWQHYPSNWTQHTTYTRAYTAARTGVIAVWEFEDIASATRLVQVGTQAEVQNRPGSYYYDGTTITVHTVRSTKPDRSLRVFHSNTCAYWPSNKSCYIQGFDFFGGGTACFWVPDSNADFVLVDCRAGFTNGNAFFFNTSGNVVTESCTAFYSGLDGFNYHASPTYGSGAMVEVDAKGFMCGWNGASNQVSTMHDGYNGVRIGGCYSGAQHQGIADVNPGTTAWNVGGTVGTSRSSGSLNVGVYLSEALAWFYDFDFGSSATGLLLGGVTPATAYLHNSSPSTSDAGLGTIDEYMQT